MGIGGSSPTWYQQGVGVAVRDVNHSVAIGLEEAGFDPNLPLAGILGRESFFEAFNVTFEGNEQVVLELRDDAPNLIPWSNVPRPKPQLLQGRK